MLLALEPTPRLTPYVHAYWFVEDMPGEHEGHPIRTQPHPGAVLSINLGRPNQMEEGPLVPKVSLLGVQSVGRRWRSWSETYFVMVLLSVPGLARLFPGAGGESADRLVELNALLGDRLAFSLHRGVAAALEPGRVRTELDRWLLRRLETIRPPPELSRMMAAHEVLRGGHRIQAAADHVGVTRRQLDRWFQAHAGLPPKQLMDLERLQASVRAVQQGRGDPLAGYSDQSHQIRAWRRRLGITPGAYSSDEPSFLARTFGGTSPKAPCFYL